MIASITELRLKNIFSFILFIKHAVRSKIQADSAQGIVSVEVKSSGLLIQRTLTVWESEEALKKYIRSGSHLVAMKSFSKIANKSYTAKFKVTSKPTWEEALEYLKTQGREHG